METRIKRVVINEDNSLSLILEKKTVVEEETFIKDERHSVPFGDYDKAESLSTKLKEVCTIIWTE